MKKVLTVGVFDMCHYGHFVLFERCKALGEYLIVAVQDTESILKYKPDSVVVYNIDQRQYVVRNIKFVDECIVYQDVDKIVEKVDFDVFAVGEDQKHEGFQRAINYCRAHNKEVVVLSRTKNVSSSELKNKIENIFW